METLDHHRIKTIIEHLNTDGESFKKEIKSLTQLELLQLIDTWANDYNDGDYSFIQYLMIALKQAAIDPDKSTNHSTT